MIMTKDWLIENRKAVGLTQQELAMKIGLSVGSLQNIEQGKRTGSVETWEKIHEVLENEKDCERNSILNSQQIERLVDHGREIGKKLTKNEIATWSRSFYVASKTNNDDESMQTHILLLLKTDVRSCEEILLVIQNKENIQSATVSLTLGMSLDEEDEVETYLIEK